MIGGAVAWYHALGFGRIEPPAALTAAAAPPADRRDQSLKHTEKWQDEVWRYYDTLGEYNYGVWWLSNMLSRVRLRAAKLQPDSDEPDIVTDGPAADLMMRLGGGVSGQAQLMKRTTVQLSIPGEGYLVGEEKNGVESWMVRSVDEIRVQSGQYSVMDENSVNLGQDWRPLAKESLVVRIWRPHDRFYHLADSPSRSAREIMRELELVNRKIQAEYLSRLASAGLVAFPNEIDFPVREEFADAPNPFMLEWIEIAAEAIQKPGTASAVIPIPIQGDADVIDKIKHIDFTMKIDEKIIEKRESAIKRLATKLDMPGEVLLGMGDVNHWSAWQLEEGALKTHIAPLAEIICDSLTRGYLQPRLAASGEDPGEWVVWYDMSELALRPDKSDNATLAYDRLELSGEAYRREMGFDEDDAPNEGDDLIAIALKTMIRLGHANSNGALNVLAGKEIMVPATVGEGAVQQKEGSVAEPGQTNPPGATPPPEPAPAAPAKGPPAERGPAPAAAAADLRRQLRIRQVRTQHALKFTAGEKWELYHPGLCTDAEYDCPFTQAVVSRPPVRPGTSGTYICHLDAFGRLLIDGQQPYLDAGSMIRTQLTPGRSNGNARR